MPFHFFSQKLQLAWVYIVILGFGEVFFQENCDGYQYFLYTTFRLF